jgi:hypothetical protein
MLAVHNAPPFFDDARLQRGVPKRCAALGAISKTLWP